MDIRRSKGPRLLPRDYNVRALGNIQDLFFRAAEGLEEDLRLTLYWSMRLMLETEGGRNFARTVPGFKYVAYGFLDPEYEEDGFGIIIFAALSLTTQKELPPEVPSFIKVEDIRFPVVIRRIIETSHQYSGSHPSGGTGACYGKSRVHGSSSLGPGILTAKHVVGSVIGAPVVLSCGCPAHVVDIGPDGIDAALVQSQCSQAHQQQIYPRHLVAPWTDVVFDGAASGRHYTKITAVTDTMGILNSSALPARVFLADKGRAGDSGALVADAQSGDPIGIYMGEYNDLAGRTGGIAQHAYQATQLMDMELYL